MNKMQSSFDLPSYPLAEQGGRGPESQLIWGGRVQVTTTTPDNARIVCELPAMGRALRQPGLMLGVTFRYRILNDPPIAGLFRVVGVVRFQSGGAGGQVELDVPANGAAIAVPAADGLIVRAYAEGTTTNIAEVEAACCLTSSPFPRKAVRSRQDVLPMAAHVAMPAFARELLSASSNLVAAFPSVNARLYTDAAAAAATAEFAAMATPEPIPGGLGWYRFVDALGVAQTVTSVWSVGP